MDWAPGGMEAHDAVEVARMAVAAGADIVDVSAGQTVPEGKPVYGRQFQTPFSDRIRHEARVPTMTVGNISSPADVNTILAAGRADLVVLARAHLWDPYWTRHAAADLGYPTSLAAGIRDAESLYTQTAIDRVCRCETSSRAQRGTLLGRVRTPGKKVPRCARDDAHVESFPESASLHIRPVSLRSRSVNPTRNTN